MIKAITFQLMIMGTPHFNMATARKYDIYEKIYKETVCVCVCAHACVQVCVCKCVFK